MNKYTVAGIPDFVPDYWNEVYGLYEATTEDVENYTGQSMDELLIEYHGMSRDGICQYLPGNIADVIYELGLGGQ